MGWRPKENSIDEFQLTCIRSVYTIDEVHVERREARIQPQAVRDRFRRCAGDFAGATFTYEDDRFAYAEQRWVTLGFLKDTVVSVVHTESSIQIRIISIRKATTYEEALFFENFPD